MLSSIRPPRIQQIRSTARLLRANELLAAGKRLISAIAHGRLTGPAFDSLLGYSRAFDSLSGAMDAARPYANGDHQNSEEVNVHLSLAEAPRPSDYAALFHMQTMTFEHAKIFDLGGNVGNLSFFMIATYTFQGIASGGSMTCQQSSKRVKSSLRAAPKPGFNSRQNGRRQMGQISCLPPVPYITSILRIRKCYPFCQLNQRISLSTARLSSMGRRRPRCKMAENIECVLYNKSKFLNAFEEIGYDAVDSWKAEELSLKIAGKLECSAPYSGYLFKLKTKGAGRRGLAHDLAA